MRALLKNSVQGKKVKTTTMYTYTSRTTRSVVVVPGLSENVLETPLPISRSTSSALLTVSASLAVGNPISKSQAYACVAAMVLCARCGGTSLVERQQCSDSDGVNAWRGALERGRGCELLYYLQYA